MVNINKLFKMCIRDRRIMPCFIRNMDEAGVKCVNVHPDNPLKHDLPTVMGVIELFDPETGFPLSVMDGTWTVSYTHLDVYKRQH